jgi:hypothetical protein
MLPRLEEMVEPMATRVHLFEQDDEQVATLSTFCVDNGRVFNGQLRYMFYSVHIGFDMWWPLLRQWEAGNYEMR